jgi:transcriptional antiterminator NusG
LNLQYIGGKIEAPMANEILHDEDPTNPGHDAAPEHEEGDVLESADDVAEEEIHATNEEIHPVDEDQADQTSDDGVHGFEREEHAPAPDVEPAGGPLKNWYIIHAYSGFENKVAESLRTRAQAFGFADRLGQILIPTEEVIELRNGKKVTSKRLLYPGYVLVEMEMDDELWHAVKSTPRVTGFVGGGTKPIPLSADEVNSVLYRQASSAERPRPKMTFEKNETVKIVDGPFTNFSGKVDEINSERSTLRVMVTIFGRSTPVELDFLQVEKI